MKSLIFIFIFKFFLLHSIAFAGTAHYVDCSAGKNGNGTFLSPWNSISSVNVHSFNLGDDVYFKVNTICMSRESSGLQIDWDGCENDRVIIGAYYGEDQFGLNGNARPILDGQANTYPSGPYSSMISMDSKSLKGYLTIQDIRINSSKLHGILAKYVDNVTITNCYTYRTRGRGIILVQSSNGVVSNNTVEEASYLTKPGAGIVITGHGVAGTANNDIVRGNSVFHSYEGIGIYKKVTNAIVEYNKLYDNRKYHIYLDASQFIIVRYNLVYSSKDVNNWEGPQFGIVTGNENANGYCFTGNNKFYGNLLASVAYGFSIGCEYGNVSDPNCHQVNNLFYNNTIVDPTISSFVIWKARSGWEGNEIKNNISWTITGDGVHTNNFSPTGFIWDSNNFDDPVSGNAAKNARIYNPKLTKTTEWRALVPGSADGNEWTLQNDSQNKNSAMLVDGYNERIQNADFTANPIRVTITTESTPSIGAWSGVTAPSSMKAPSNFRKSQ